MTPDKSRELWTDKHRPRTLGEIAGQQKTIHDILSWLSEWKPGNGLFLHGPPGIGKNLIVETIAKENGYDLLQLDASDERNQKGIESALGGSTKIKPLFHKGRFVLIDEIDGISGRSDRGGITGVVKIIRDSVYPVFVIANEPYKPKLKPLKTCCKLIKVPKVRSPSVEKRLREICAAEGLEHNGDSLKNLARWSQGDMRSAINDLQMICNGKTCVMDSDMESLGFRERKNEFYNILPTIFHSRRIDATRKAIWDSEMDPDEAFWWIEQNLQLEVNRENLADALEVLSKADMFRAKVVKQQNWRFKAFMVDLMSSVSLFRSESHGYAPYKPPKKLIDLGRTRIRRAMIKSLSERIGSVVHNSTGVVRREYFPYLKILLKNPEKEPEKSDFTIELDDEDIKLLKG